MKKQASNLFVVALLLALTGGFLDTYSYLCRGGVFANAETGNIVLFGVSMVEQDWEKAIHYLIPILAFSVGILVAEFFNHKFKHMNFLHWRQIIIGVETALLIVVAYLPQEQNALANIIISLVCAMQVETFRKFDNIICATTMCTGNLRSSMEWFYRGMVKKEPLANGKGARFLAVNLFFVIGVLGAVPITQRFEESSVAVAIAPLILVFLIMFIREGMEDQEK